MPKKPHERYTDGTLVATRKRAQEAYKLRQQAQRRWVSGIAEHLRVSKEDLVKLPPDRVADHIAPLTTAA